MPEGYRRQATGDRQDKKAEGEEGFGLLATGRKPKAIGIRLWALGRSLA